MKSDKLISESEMIKLIDNYNLGSYLSFEFIDSKNSFIYLISTKKYKYVLKSQKDNENTAKEIKWQKEVSDYLFSKGVNCQRVIYTKNNDVVVIHNKREYHLLTYIKGRVLHDEYDKKTYKSVAKNIALMQKAFMNFKKGE